VFPLELVIGFKLTCCVWMSRAATPSCLIAAITRRMADELAASARLAVEPSFVTPNEKLARSGVALIVASALTLIVLFTDLEEATTAGTLVSQLSVLARRHLPLCVTISDPGLIRGRSGPRKWLGDFRRRGLEKSRPVITALEGIGAAHGATPAQVALAWLLQLHGEAVVAIPGATSVEQARENAAAADLRLTPAEIMRLDEVSRTFR